MLSEGNVSHYIPEPEKPASISEMANLNAENLESLNEKIAEQKRFSAGSTYHGDKEYDTAYEARSQSAHETINRHALRNDDLQSKINAIRKSEKITWKKTHVEDAVEDEEEDLDGLEKSDEPKIDPEKPFGKFTARNRTDTLRRKNLAIRFSGMSIF